MTLSEEIITELEAKRKECEVAGCMDGCVREADCIKRHNELKSCMGGIKDTMQVKTNVAWEIFKLVAIPLATAGIIYWGAFSSLRTEVTMMSETVKHLNALVIDVIKDKR